ncbi:hypothetical protein V5O48_004958 [Marasmius crinis-equi]|uniref:PH domain-containing protein n=1 Tax=Marasmius crinis-equi TaxID=585013 RepID=A0ABR3FNL8_9AGAR
MLGPREMEGARSTKQLISRYETLNYPPFVSKPTSSPSFFKRLSSLSTKKERSAVRQSFRNLVGLLKKSKDEFKVGGTHQKSAPSQDSTSPGETPISIPLPMDHADSQSSTGSAHSGPLFYLSRTQFYSWTNCSAELEETRIVLSWATSTGIPDRHSISLKQCVDVRSLDHSELDPEVVALLPTREDGEHYKVFEVLYQDDSKETFAAAFTRERARWVSSIWDSVLSAQEAKSAFRHSIVAPQSQNITQSRLDIAKPLPELNERALPILPADSGPLGVQSPASDGLPFHNASPDLAVHTENTSLSIHFNTAHATSPSITNISTRSVVKQRLAQMERQNSSHSSRSVFLTSNHRNVSSAEPDRIQCLGSGKSAMVDSILDAYQDETEQRTALHSASSFDFSPQFKTLQERLARLADREQLDEKFLSLQLNVQNIPSSLAGVMNSRNEHVTAALERISRLASSVNNQSSNNHAVLQSIEQKLQEMKTCHTEEQPLSDRFPAPNDEDCTRVLQTLETVQASLVSELANVLRKLDDISELNGALSKKMERPIPVTPPVVPAEIAEILKLMKEEETHRTAQAQQQVDSVRYLNELNVWLEAFVNNGTSHIQGMSSSLKQLCDTLGFSSAHGIDQNRNLLSDLHKLVQETHAREQHAATLQETVNSIAIHLNSSVGHILSPHAMADLMNQHRREHEGLLKALTQELSQEIRGERLRFVEAMKEATAINISMHVEEFKKELKREVQGMTQEVTRLYQEKQNMENQIAELFAFHAKQKTGHPKASIHRNIPPDYGGAPRFQAQPSSGRVHYQ